MWEGIRFKGSILSFLNIDQGTIIENSKIAIKASPNSNHESPNISIDATNFSHNKYAIDISADYVNASNITITNSEFVDPLDLYAWVYFPNAEWFDISEIPEAYVVIKNYLNLTFNNNTLAIPLQFNSNFDCIGCPPTYPLYEGVRQAMEISNSNSSANYTLENNTFNRWKRAIHLSTEGNIDILNGNTFNASDVGDDKYFIKTEGAGTLTVDGATFNNSEGDAAILLYDLAYASITNSTFNSNYRNIYMTVAGSIKDNDILNIKAPNDSRDCFGLFVVGEANREISANTFTGMQSIGSGGLYGTNTYGAIFEQTGSSFNNFFANTLSGVDIGMQVEGANTDFKFRCNVFEADGNKHKFAGCVFTNYNNNMNLTYGSFRDQGEDCDYNFNPAGNQWMHYSDPLDDTERDIFMMPTEVNCYPLPTVYPIFKYVAHGKETNDNNGVNGIESTTVPRHNLGSFWDITDPTDPNYDFRLQKCLLGDLGYEKISTSCNSDAPGLPPPNGGGGVVGVSIADLINIKTQLALDKLTKLNLLTNPEIQTDLVAEIKQIDTKLDEVILKLTEFYKEADQLADAKLLLETETSIEGKKQLVKIYNKENDDVKSRLVQDDIETLSINKPAYLYRNLDEKQAFEYNNLYFKEINELKIQVKEDNRALNELLVWEKMALELIVESGLPVAKDAEGLLAKNNVEAQIHPIMKIPLFVLNQQVGQAPFNYNLNIVPNPAMLNTNISVEIPTDATTVELKVFDAYNNQGLLQTHSLTSGSNTTNINVQNLISGLYIVVIEVDGVSVADANLIVIH